MHPAAVALGILAICALLCRTLRLCARRQRDAFLDHERASFRAGVTKKILVPGAANDGRRMRLLFDTATEELHAYLAEQLHTSNPTW